MVALVSSLLIIAADAFLPAFRLREWVGVFLPGIDFNETLMRGMLAFLLFAGALHLGLEGLLENKWTIAALATLGVLLSTAIVAALTWWALQRVGIDIAFDVCLAFGALISPTDPIAVMGLLKEMRAPRHLESLIAGEALFNDGIAVVVFFAIVSAAGLSADDLPTVAGRVGLVIVVLVAGVAIGYRGERVTRRAAPVVYAIFNAVLLLLLGLQVFTSASSPATLARGLLAIPIVLFARVVSVAVPIRLACLRRGVTRGTIPIVTWSGLRGGLSVAMMLSLPPFPERDLLLASTYAVVVFSILAQGLTVRRLLVHYRMARGSG